MSKLGAMLEFNLEPFFLSKFVNPTTFPGIICINENWIRSTLEDSNFM